MNISSICNNNINFKGLWGKSFRKSDIDSTLNIMTVRNEYYYYPFADETKEQIDIVANTHSSADIINNKYYINECKICARTPFTSKEYMEYAKAKKYMPELKPVDDYSQTKYITYAVNNQVSAVNKCFVA